jgi:integrase
VKVKPSQIDTEVLNFGPYSCTIYRRGDVIDSSWYFRHHLAAENRFFRKSLKTKDRATAVQNAGKELFDLIGKMTSGERILALSLQDLHDRFSKHMELMVEQKQISPKTWSVQKGRVLRGIEFLGTKYPSGVETKITSIDGAVFQDYLTWRIDTLKEKGKTIRLDVVRDELLVIRKMFLWAKAQRPPLLTERNIPNWYFEVEREDAKRERITERDFKTFFNTMVAWAREDDEARERYHRSAVAHLATLVSLSALRSGEAFGLTNRDIEVINDNEFVLNVRAETSKVKRGRQVHVEGPVIHSWVKKNQRHKASTDFLFAPYDTGKTSFRDVFYHTYTTLRERLKEIDLGHFDLYHCRHYWATDKLTHGENVYDVAVAMGTSVKEIESTYSHVLPQAVTKRFNERKAARRAAAVQPSAALRIIRQKMG